MNRDAWNFGGHGTLPGGAPIPPIARDCPGGCGVRLYRFDGDVLALDRDMGAHIRGAHPYPAVPRPSGRHPFTFAEWVSLVMIAASVGFLAGVGLALVLG